MTHHIANLRTEYKTRFLLENDVRENPIQQFEEWWKEVVNAKIEEPNAMTLATASLDGMPAARLVLLKGFDENGFVFFTSYESYKAIQLSENPKACLVFYWKELERQVRITGLVSKVPQEESDEYFASRPHGSKISAWVSPQSKPIESREWLDNKFNEVAKEYTDVDVKRPSFWGGYIVQPVIMEFWQGRTSRLHDRIQYTLQEGGEWKVERLGP
ncbi:MAG: pyridoxamine 5'-phosphate oxidase [Chitinophagaceae bacterium]